MRLVVLVLFFPVAVFANETDVDIAKRHYVRGQDLYNSGLYAEAIKEFEAAHAVLPKPDFDYNIAVCHDRLEDWQKAVEAYERYLEHVSQASDTDTVRQRIAIIRHRMAETPEVAPSPAVALALMETVKPLALAVAPQKRKRLAPWLVGSGALVLGVVGAGLLGSATADYNSLSSSCAPNCDRSVWGSLPAREHAGEAMLGLAGAVAVVDVVLWVMERRRK